MCIAEIVEEFKAKQKHLIQQSFSDFIRKGLEKLIK